MGTGSMTYRADRRPGPEPIHTVGFLSFSSPGGFEVKIENIAALSVKGVTWGALKRRRCDVGFRRFCPFGIPAAHGGNCAQFARRSLRPSFRNPQ
jgi:hypothetical protein